MDPLVKDRGKTHMAIVQFVVNKKNDATYQLVGVKSADSSSAVVINEYASLADAHRAWRDVETLPHAPVSDARELIFNKAKRGE